MLKFIESMLRIVWASSILLLSIATYQRYELPFGIDNRLEYQVDEFIYQANIRKIKVDKTTINIGFGDTDPTNYYPSKPLGICIPYYEGIKYPWSIIINEKIYNILTQESREMLVFHELGHCVLDKDHEEIYNKKGITLSLMHPYAFPNDYTYLENREHYLNELFFGPSYILKWSNSNDLE